MDFAVYCLYRLAELGIRVIPLPIVFRIGQFLGLLFYYLVPNYRKLAKNNLALAFDEQKLSQPELRKLTKKHFIHLGANVLSSIKASMMKYDDLINRVSTEGIDQLASILSGGKGAILVLSHLGNWELFAQLCKVIPNVKWGTIYQPLGNTYAENHLRKFRMRNGVVLFNRRTGFNGPTKFLREGGAVAVLVDQHAGDRGVWTPFFGRLASTTTLASILSLRTEAPLVPLAIYTSGTARWKLVISKPVEVQKKDETKRITAEELTLRVNQVVESQVRVSPADWFWVHNRWKTPNPNFLFSNYRRGVALEDSGGLDKTVLNPKPLKPFRILIRSTNWLGDAIMAIPAVRAIATGRPDAELTILTQSKLADIWSLVPEVKDLILIEKTDSVFSVGRKIKNAGPFDAAVLLPNSIRSAIEIWLGDVPRRIGYKGRFRKWLLNQIVVDLPRPARQVRHQFFHYVEIAQQLGADIESLKLTISDSSEKLPERKNSNSIPTILVCPGAEYGPAKQWLPDRYAAVILNLSQTLKYKCKWQIVGTGKDTKVAQQIIQELNSINEGEGEIDLQDLTGKTSLRELISIIRDSRLLITNDTGTMHLAALLETPLVAIFGSTEPDLTGPVCGKNGISKVLRHKVECSPCFLRECPIDFKCMKSISVSQVVKAALQILGTSIHFRINT